jgi:hypothetical protein
MAAPIVHQGNSSKKEHGIQIAIIAAGVIASAICATIYIANSMVYGDWGFR